MKHTPGPWNTEYATGNNFTNAHWRIYGLGSVQNGAFRNWIATTTPHNQAKENARLIAAAPELLEALRQTCMVLRVAPINWTKNIAVVDALKQADDAIAKATGGE